MLMVSTTLDGFYFANCVLCPRCDYLAENFNRSKVFCSFLGWIKIFLVNSL